MPVWYCSYCSHWHSRKCRFCQYCGRAPEGRVCRTCQIKLSNEARFCPQCGGDRLTEPAEGGFQLSRRARWLLAAVSGLAVWGLSGWTDECLHSAGTSVSMGRGGLS